MVVIILLLTLATFLEHTRGTAFVARNIYHTWWFCALWGVGAVLMVWALVRARLWRRVSVLALHLSFVVILAGALVTFVTSEKGYVALQEGREAGSFLDGEKEGLVHALPFVVRLDSFRVECYPGTEAPADYVSHLTVLPAAGGAAETVRLSMNRIYTRAGYRFYQSSFDEGGRVSVVSVNYDPWGTGITYAGYVLLALSMLGVLLNKKERFLRLLHHPLLRRGAAVALLLLLPLGAQAERRTLPAFTREKADSLAEKQVIYNDRVAPFNTLARDFVVKLTGTSRYGGLTPEQVVSGWLLRPDAWQNEPMILIKSSELRERLGLTGRYARLTDLFDAEGYRLSRLWQGGDPANAQGSLQKAIAEVDEKVGLIQMLQSGTLIVPRPADVAPLSDLRVRAEILYNRLDAPRWLFMVDLGLGLIAFFFLIFQIKKEKSPLSKAQSLTTPPSPPGEGGKGGRGRWLCLFPLVLLLLSTLLLTLTYALRWYIGSRIPLSNGYETMLFMALASGWTALLLARRFPVMVPFGFLLSGFTLLVAHLGQMNPQITPLVPVLVSPWLSAHVSFVMMSYALLAFICLCGVMALCAPREAERLMLLSRLMLYPAVFLLGAGIFLGAVWANQSWGSYWTWDPKEVWALITFLVYATLFHTVSLPALRRPRTFHIFAIAAFACVLMTYFGVNFLLGGMHSYAN